MTFKTSRQVWWLEKVKNIVAKEELLKTSNFFFCHNVFNRRQRASIYHYGKGIRKVWTTMQPQHRGNSLASTTFKTWLMYTTVLCNKKDYHHMSHIWNIQYVPLAIRLRALWEQMISRQTQAVGNKIQSDTLLLQHSLIYSFYNT